METTQITVKEVDKRIFHELKAEAAKRNITVGIALTLAIEKWVSSLKQTQDKLSRLKPRNWGQGTERLSEDIDKILYGNL